MDRTTLPRGMVRASLAVTALLLIGSDCHTAVADGRAEEVEEPPMVDANEKAFAAALAQPWHVVLSDDGTGDWTRHWFLDGDKARVVNSPEGMALYAGPVPDDDSCHAVLWTKRSFKGDIKVEYDYARLDKSHRGVNILYLLATGSGEAPYAKDITEWNELRRVPSMGLYFRNMNTYSLSYAAGPYNEEGQSTGDDYVRARRYMPEGKTLRGTALEPEYRRTGFFLEDVPHHIVVIKSGDQLFMKVENPSQRKLFAWQTDMFPAIFEGRVGLRQMFTRSACYRNIKISLLDD